VAFYSILLLIFLSSSYLNYSSIVVLNLFYEIKSFCTFAMIVTQWKCKADRCKNFGAATIASKQL